MFTMNSVEGESSSTSFPCSVKLPPGHENCITSGPASWFAPSSFPWSMSKMRIEALLRVTGSEAVTKQDLILTIRFAHRLSWMIFPESNVPVLKPLFR